MNAERWQRVKQLLDQAIAFDVDNRSSYLDRECGSDSELRSEVESLLSSHQQAGSGFLREPAINRWGDAAAGVAPARDHRMGPYQLVEEIGHGGMGEVYRAIRADGEYEKEVAIKFVRGGFAQSFILERFRNERQILASLDHPNIARLLDGGTTEDGVPYLVMDLIDGVSIDRYCDDHTLSVTDRLHLFRRICEAVQYAHQRMVIHRDIKPSNILVTKDGVPKLLDFGIAKLLDPSSGVGTTLARPMTPEYASPEQISGAPVTASTDVYSLGVVLYQLLTGRSPYPGDTTTPHGLARAICDEDPLKPSTAVFAVGDPGQKGEPHRRHQVSATTDQSPAKLHRRLRGDLDNVLLMALRKDASQRYASVEQFSDDIRRHLEHTPVLASRGTLVYRASKFFRRHRTGVAASAAFVGTLASVGVAVALILGFNSSGSRHRGLAPAGIPKIESLAVLPLRNLSNDPQQEYFTDGMTEELITDLAKSRGLRVISHTSVERYKRTTLSFPEIARELAVDAIVEGTVLRTGDRVRVTAQLIDGRSDQHLWAYSYDRSLRDILNTENDVSNSIAETVKLKLSPEQKEYLASARPVDPEAHDEYLKGRFFWSQRTESDLKKAIDSFQRAIAKDPYYAPAYAGLADTYFYLGYAWGRMPPTQAMPLARAAAQKAIELDSNSAEGHASLATVELTYDWNFQGAEQEFKRAIALNPNYEWSHHAYSALLISVGRPDEAVAQARNAVEVDPLSVPARNILGLELQWAGRLDESIQEDLKTLEIDPNPIHLASIHGRLQDSYERKGMHKEAFEEHVKTQQAYGVDSKGIDQQRKIYAENGWRGITESDLKSALNNWQKEHWHFNAFIIAGLYARLGDKDQAFAWLNRCVELRSTIMYSIDADPAGTFAPLRSDPRFGEIKRKMAMPGYAPMRP
jgi:eukaryotic-like serine/threonine-protein kinase